VESLRDLIEVYDREVGMLERHIHQHLRHHRGYQAVQATNGSAARSRPSWSLRSVTSPGSRHHATCARGLGSPPGRRESDVKGHDESITKKGSKLLRWSLIEGISRYHGGPHLTPAFHRLAERRGRNKARVAIARRVLTLAHYGLRDGEIRCLTQPVEAA
jgi:hypothetical protein